MEKTGRQAKEGPKILHQAWLRILGKGLSQGGKGALFDYWEVVQ